jgi:hypothetical protein
LCLEMFMQWFNLMAFLVSIIDARNKNKLK